MIYDDHIASSGVPTVSPNYTVVFDNYDSVQNLIGYMMEGTDFISIDISKKEEK